MCVAMSVRGKERSGTGSVQLSKGLRHGPWEQSLSSWGSIEKKGEGNKGGDRAGQGACLLWSMLVDAEKIAGNRDAFKAENVFQMHLSITEENYLSF